MTTSTYEKFAVIKPNILGGLEIRTSPSLKELLTDLMVNSGEEIALWCELEGKRCADIWRAQLALEALPVLPVRGESFICEACGNGFGDAAELQDHSETCTGD
jgi:hypothetical protein